MRIVAIGEGMAEFRRDGSQWKQGYGGDVLNTAIHLHRLGHDVAFASAIGTDPFSRQLREAWQQQGLDLDLLATDRERQCGIYFIETDDRGERSFIYWRERSAARRMVSLLGDRLADHMAKADLVYLSLITVAILPDDDRQILLDMLEEATRAGARIAFDSNYRPLLWEDETAARRWKARFCSIAAFGLPTLEDEMMLGDGASAEAVQAFWFDHGCKETVVKAGDGGCILPDGTRLPPDGDIRVVDTTGAGDSFNAGYLSVRLAGIAPASAARAGNGLAGWVIGQRGAIPPHLADVYAGIARNADGDR